MHETQYFQGNTAFPQLSYSTVFPISLPLTVIINRKRKRFLHFGPYDDTGVPLI